MPSRFDYRVIFDKLDSQCDVTRGTVVSFAHLPNNIIKVVVRHRRKRKTYEVEVDPKEVGRAALVSAMYQIRDVL